MRKIPLLIICSLIFHAGYASAVNSRNLAKAMDEAPEKALNTAEFSREVNEKMGGIKTFNFTFRQNTYIADSTQTVVAEVSFERPDKLYVKYSEPQTQEFIFNKGTLYTYIPEIKQATSQKKDDISNVLGVTPSVILSGDSFHLLEKDFNLSVNTSGKHKNMVLLEAFPVNRDDFDKMVIFFNGDTLLPEKTVVTAPNFKSVTSFTEYKLNLQFGEDYFDFNPDKEVNIIEIN
ncbi:outer membrane lipoprotein carrier protein LolA [Elusimicrobiota bacterium]